MKKHFTIFSVLFLLSEILFMASCTSEPEETGTSLTTTVWKLMEINGQPAPVGAERKELSLIIAPDGPRIGGYAGCNRYSGAYELEDDQLKFFKLNSTLMECAVAMDLERSYKDALRRTRQYFIDGEKLALSDSSGLVIMRFEPVY